MQNSNGYIMLWEPMMQQTGQIFVCGTDGTGSDRNILAFRLIEVDDSALRLFLVRNGFFAEPTGFCDDLSATVIRVAFRSEPDSAFAFDITRL